MTGLEPTISRGGRARLALSSPFALPLAVVALVLAGVIGAWARPRVPRHVVLSTGFKNSTYHRVALDYRAILARHGVTLELRESRGAPENLARLDDPASDVEVGFLQSGILNGDRTTSEGLRESVGIEHPELVALASVFYEPLWIFHRMPNSPTLFTELAGKRIAIGGASTSTQVLLRQLLPMAGLPFDRFEAREIGGGDAVKALASGALDVVMVTSSETSPLVKQLAAIPGVKLMSLAHAEAYARRLSWLAHLTLPRGGLDLAQDFPPENVALVSPMASLVARRGIHPSIVLMLMEAAVETHSEAGAFQRLHEFPSVEHLELPVDAGARKYVLEGPSILEQHLPFTVALFVRRLSLALPAIAILFSILKYAPVAYAWWVNQRIYRWYGQLRTIEDELEREAEGADLSPYVPRIDEVASAVARLSTPVRYSDRVYTLRQHIDFVREKLERFRATRT